ncbi:dynactin subunit 3 isoform X2 [Macaca fascicularis]|uniref:dynactin subunit 3 isoform X2 n=1 Tax=Macaca fascicularis TaxID=9541 RepID=UPI001E258F14|nr:dynactin subunit 3 isoform X2 [Macaca fascicularis]
MAGLTDVQRLQARVEELERWVYGPGGARGSRKVADGLVKVQVALGNIASKRERVKILYKKIEDLIKYLDPEYIDRIAIPDASKLQFILAAVPEHAARLQHLAQIHIQQQVWEGRGLEGKIEVAQHLIPTHATWGSSFRPFCCSFLCYTLALQDQCVEITEESKALLEEYNKTTMLLSKQFVQWDELLCQLEAAKQVKPAEE